MVKGFQHSQPQSVYRQKNRAIIGLMIPLSLAMFGFSVYRFVTRPNEDLFLASVWLINLVNFSHTFFRIRLTLSPAGISVVTGGSMATTWLNVERIQMIPRGYLIKREAPCLVLREPLPAKQLLGFGVPAELKGRVVPIHPAAWERMFTLQDEIYGYLKANSVIDNDHLSVPIDFTSISQRQTRFVWRIAAALGLLWFFMIGAVLLIGIF